MKAKLNVLCLLATIIVSLGATIGLNNSDSQKSQQATAIFTYAASAGEFAGEELTAKQRGVTGCMAVGAYEATKFFGSAALAFGWCPIGWLAGAAAVTMLA